MRKTLMVQSVERVLSILECFTANETELSVPEISQLLDLPRPTVARLAYTLEERGYLVRKAHTKKYSLGIKLFRLGVVAQSGIQLTALAVPFLRDLRGRLNETVYLDVVEGLDRVCVLSFEGNQAIRTVVPVGQRSPLYAGADGRVLLAYQSPAVIQELAEKTGLAPFTENTITSRQELEDSLGQIRALGYAVSYGECTPGSVGVSCPVPDSLGRVKAAISISAPQYRINEDAVKVYIVELQNAARALARQLGNENGQALAFNQALNT